MTPPLLSGILGCVGLLAACTGGGPAREAPRDAVFIGIPADVPSLLPVLSRSASDAWVLNAVSWPLLEARFECALSWEPALAESWSVSPDGRTIGLALRPAATWEDGAPVTSRDVAFSFDLAADPVVGSRLADRLRVIDPLARPTVLGDHEVTFRFLAALPTETALAILAQVPVLPHHLLGHANRAALRHHFANTHPLVCGPWRVSRWRPDDTLVLEANPRFTGPEEDAARLSHVVFRILPAYATRIDELEHGGLDVVRDLSLEDADRLARTRPEITLRRRGWRTLEYIGWNIEDSLFEDPAVRRALTMAVNRDRLVDELLTSNVTGERYGRPAVGPVSPALCDAHADEILPLPFDPAAARAALAAAGWTDRNGDGVLDRMGRTFSVRLLLPSGMPRREAVATRVQADLGAVGVEVVLEPVAPSAYQARLLERDFQAVLGAWSASPWIELSDTWHSGPDRTFNFISYANPEVDLLLDSASADPDPLRALAAWKRIQALIYQDQPYTFLFWADEIVAVHGRFRDARVDLASPWGRLEHWWVPLEEIPVRPHQDGIP